MKQLRTQVAIVGAGPAGLLLGHLLERAGIDSVIVEARSRAYVEQRVRAGVLEHGSAELLAQVGVGARMLREGLVHHGIELRFLGVGHRLDLHALSGGRAITVYGQQEVVKDLIAARVAAGGELLFETSELSIHGLTSDAPSVHFVADGQACALQCDFIAGCDGFHGPCRPSVPPSALRVYERSYPFAWLGILARARPASHELIYAYHERGFALHSMRSPEVSRLYLQVAADESLASWSERRIWDELGQRLSGDGLALHEGPLIERAITGMRSFVVEPMQYGRLFLAGDAAHIVPPTGAKGMNLALADVYVMSRALAAFYATGEQALLAGYSQRCLERVWRAEHFSWWMTSMLHRAPDGDAFQHKLQLAQLAQLVSSRAAATTLAENYVGLPLPGLETSSQV